MEKLLKPYTIVPDHLYVQRDADKQVASIISDMGRPGYVLVSRQMGKTNLLLNAKSKLEKPEDAFIYVDLSNVFDTSRECFENIIDTALESHYEKFGDIKEKIYEQRRSSINLPPHRQHINELKILVESLKGGKLVIILDEIDALTKTDYSDQIFSQIRSMYFSARVNNNNFTKLTYLLSGVVEPTEIIKDPKVSPFNIGQKIYLNDFSKDEFLKFLEIANLHLENDSIDRIYYWTHGNPRMTWDVSAEIEVALENQICTIELIDSIVNKLYLKSYDKAPIDNIREIVTNDKEIRNSIVEISYGNGKNISDKIKSKLYLSGIINYNDKDVVIKNQIIQNALNLSWIRSIEEEEKGLVKTALDYISQENYQEALVAFEKYLSENEFDMEESSTYYYYLGLAAYRTNDLKKASFYLGQSNFDPTEDPKSYYNLHHIQGIVYYFRNMIEESLKALKVVIDGERNDETYMRALSNYGSFSLLSNEEEQKMLAKEIFTKIITEELPEKVKAKKIFSDELTSVAYFNLGVLAKDNSDYGTAINYFYKAYEITNGQKPNVIVALIKLLEDKDEKIRLIEQLINMISEGKVKPTEVNPEKGWGSFTFDDFKELIFETYILPTKSLFKKIIPFSILLGKDSIAENLYDVALMNISKSREWEKSSELLYDIYLNEDGQINGLDGTTKVELVKLLAYTLDYSKYQNIFEDYTSFLEKNLITNIDFLDFGIVHKIINGLIDKKEFDKALLHVSLIKKYEKNVSSDLIVNYLLINHDELNVLSHLNETDKAIFKAREILEQAKLYESKSFSNHLISNDNKIVIKKNAESFLYVKANQIPSTLSKKKYGRNDRVNVLYKNGRSESIKYKKIELILKRGDCIIVDW